MKRLIALAFVAALTACGGSHSNSNGAQDPCDAAGIGGAIDSVTASSDTPAKKAYAFEDLAAGITQCESVDVAARTDPKDPLNLQLARVNLAAGKAYILAGNKADAKQHFAYAAFTAKFIGNPDIAAEANTALAEAQ